MKKRNKKTGEIVNIVDYRAFSETQKMKSDYVSFIDNSGNERRIDDANIYIDFEDLDNKADIIDTEISFNEVRAKAAIAAMQGMLAHSARMYIGNETNWHEAIAKESVKLADSLISNLKKPIDENY